MFFEIEDTTPDKFLISQFSKNINLFVKSLPISICLIILEFVKSKVFGGKYPFADLKYLLLLISTETH